jgi:predicted GH43/DUF377 family glycosyl hydrolase
MNNNLDIYDADIFDINGLHCLEQDSPYKVPFRWSEGIFTVKAKTDIKNLLISFLCLGEDKKIIIFLENEIKNTKHSFSLKNGGDYILAINLEDYKKATFYISPNVKLSNEDVRTLGIFVKNIYINDLDIKNVELIEKEDKNFSIYKNENSLYLNSTTQLVEKSIFEQNLNIKILPFKYNSKNFLFNSSIFKFQNRKYLFARKSAFVTNKITDNTLVLFDYETLRQININIIDEIPFEQYEDPRVFVHNNKIYVSCVNYTHDKFHLIHQKILIFDENFNHIGNIHPKYGYNGKTIAENLGKEKNWTFFTKDNRLFCIYSIDPHIIVEFDWDGNVKSEFITYFDTTKLWKYGACRGGSNPIYKDGYMHSFFHSSIPWGKGRRRYIMGKYKFNPEPPFDIIEFDSEAIIWGNEKDERILKDINPPVVFPCGAILDNNNFHVSFGFNDEKTGIILI